MATNTTKKNCLHLLSFSQILEAKTKFNYEEFAFRWELEVPCNRDSLNHTFDSPIFVGGEQSQHLWQLRWISANPYVDYNRNRDTFLNHTVQLILVAVGKESSFQGKKIKAHARINLKKNEEAKFLKDESGHEKVPLEVCEEDYIHRNACKSISVKDCDLWDEKNGYIVNKTITVCCRILISCISSNRSASKLFSVSSGESYACFNDENISRSIAEVTKNAWSALDFTDVELVTDTKSFPAHKVVLAAYSPVFSAMFRTNMKEMKDNSVEIKDFGEEAVEAMLEFIYTGKILKFAETSDYFNARELLQIADKYQITVLKAQCEVFLCLKINVQDAVEMLELANLYSCNKLKHVVLQFIMRNKTEVYETDSFKKLTDPSIFMELLKFN